MCKKAERNWRTLPTSTSNHATRRACSKRQLHCMCNCLFSLWQHSIPDDCTFTVGRNSDAFDAPIGLESCQRTQEQNNIAVGAAAPPRSTSVSPLRLRVPQRARGARWVLHCLRRSNPLEERWPSVLAFPRLPGPTAICRSSAVRRAWTPALRKVEKPDSAVSKAESSSPWTQRCWDRSSNALV